METEMIIKPRLAFTGLDHKGRNLLRTVAEKDIAEILMVNDLSHEFIFEAMNINPSSAATTNFEDLLNADNIDGLVISTPDAHVQKTIAALSNECAVFCDIPLGKDEQDVKKILKTAREYNRLLNANYSYRYIQAFQEMSHIIRAGELGDIYHVEMKCHFANCADSPFTVKNGSMHGCVAGHGVHLIDLMLYALDFPEVRKLKKKLYNNGMPLKKNYEPEDFATVWIEFENDILATLSCSCDLHSGIHSNMEISFYGTDCSVSMKNVQGSYFDFESWRFYGSQYELIYSSINDDWSSRALVRWIRNLSAETGFNTEALCYLEPAKILDMIYEK